MRGQEALEALVRLKLGRAFDSANADCTVRLTSGGQVCGPTGGMAEARGPMPMPQVEAWAWGLSGVCAWQEPVTGRVHRQISSLAESQ